MPLILGTNSIKDTGYNVANSARFETNTYLTKSASSGNTKTFTVSFWCKRAALGSVASGSNQFPLSFYQDTDNRISIAFLSTNAFIIYAGVSGSTKIELTTDRLFKDVSAWYHIVIAVDTTQGTEGNRVKIYVNGVQETSFSTATYPSQNDDLTINTNIYVGTYDTSNNFFHGYLTEVVFIDGSALAQTSFGEFDEDSPTIWKPIDVSGLTFGTNGFYLEFKQSGTSQNSSGIGADTSGQDNHFAVNNLTAIDQTTDTCTNNYSTYNPLQPAGSNTFSNGNLTAATPSSGGHGPINNFAIPKSGKWYWEVKIDSTSGNISDNLRIGMQVFDINNLTNPTLGDIRYISNATKNVDSSNSSYGATYSSGDIISVAVDSDGNSVEFFKNGSSQGSISYTQNSSDYFAVTAEASSSLAATYSFNFGNPPFSISSSNSDGNGYGNFEYAVPSGYFALNSKNLAEYG